MTKRKEANLESSENTFKVFNYAYVELMLMLDMT